MGRLSADSLEACGGGPGRSPKHRLVADKVEAYVILWRHQMPRFSRSRLGITAVSYLREGERAGPAPAVRACKIQPPFEPL